MFKLIKRLLHRTACSHASYKVLGQHVEGATLGWDLQPTRQFAFTYECLDCGRVWREGGFVLHYDKRLRPHLYDDDGWPINETGTKLEISED